MKRAASRLILAGLFLLLVFSIFLAVNRVYQVDECQNVYMAGVLASRAYHAFYTDASAFNLALSFLFPGDGTSSGIFASARMAMLVLFWFNIILLALNTGERLFSGRGLFALFAAATLAPVWDYGLEVRHDNVMLAGLLLSWYLLRVRPAGLRSYALAGAIAAGLQLAVFKAFAYLVPFSLAFLVFAPAGHKEGRGRRCAAWAAGFLAVFMAARLIYGAMGIWDVYVADLRGYTAALLNTARFLPLETLARLPAQTPLLLCLVGAALVRSYRQFKRRGAAAVGWDSNWPEVILFAGAAAVLAINPTPYPYNLLHLVPYAFLLAFRYARELVKDLESRPALIPFAWSVFLFAHMAPFAIATARHAGWTNARQKQLMSLAESLTDAKTDPVYDAIGMVPTRPSIDFHWYIQSLNRNYFVDGTWPPVRAMLGRTPAAVLIPSYRTDWLTREDNDFIGGRYVALSDDFWVLGQVLLARGGEFEIVHAGRYRVSCLSGSDLPGAPAEDAGRLAGTLDAAPLSAGVLKLGMGPHKIASMQADCHPTLVWVGPLIDRIGPLAQSDHRRLFVNWY